MIGGDREGQGALGLVIHGICNFIVRDEVDHDGDLGQKTSPIYRLSNKAT